MGHNVGKQAALAVAAGTKRGAAAMETRTPDEIIKGIRGNLNSPLTILKTDVAILLKNYDALVAGVELLQKQLDETTASLGIANLDVEQKDDVIANLQAQIALIRGDV